MMNVLTQKIFGSPLTGAPSAISGSAASSKASPIAIDLQASRQLWNGLHAG